MNAIEHIGFRSEDGIIIYQTIVYKIHNLNQFDIEF